MGQYTQQQLLLLKAVCCSVLLASCPEYRLLWRWQQQQRVVLGMQRHVFINDLQFLFMHIASIESICPRLLLLFFAAKQTVNRSSATFFAQVTRGPSRVSASKCGLVASHGHGGRRSRHSSTYRT